MAYGPALRKLRKKAGKTLQDVAGFLGVSIPYVADLERERRLPLDPAKNVKLAEFLSADPDELLRAAARDRGAFHLDATASPKQRSQVGAILTRAWKKLDERDLDRIRRIAERKASLKWERPCLGRRTRPLSYAKIERLALRVRRQILPDLLPAEPVPGIALFESLDEVTLSFDGINASMDYDVDNLPHGLEGYTRYDSDQGGPTVTLDDFTYRALAAGNGRALYCLGHEFGHAILHLELLMEEGPQKRDEEEKHGFCEDTEWQANAFSAAFLVPAAGLADLERSYGGLDAHLVRSCFRVSKEAAQVRLGVYTERRDQLLREG